MSKMTITWAIAALSLCATAGAQAGDVPCSKLKTLRSLSYSDPGGADFHNATSERRKVYWLDYEGKVVSYGSIAPDGHMEQRTFATHPFVFTTPKGVCTEIFIMTGKTRTIELTK